MHRMTLTIDQRKEALPIRRTYHNIYILIDCLWYIAMNHTPCVTLISSNLSFRRWPAIGNHSPFTGIRPTMLRIYILLGVSEIKNCLLLNAKAFLQRCSACGCMRSNAKWWVRRARRPPVICFIMHSHQILTTMTVLVSRPFSRTNCIDSHQTIIFVPLDFQTTIRNHTRNNIITLWSTIVHRSLDTANSLEKIVTWYKSKFYYLFS